MQGTRAQDRSREPLKRRRRRIWIAAGVGLLIGVLAGIILELVNALEGQSEQTTSIRELLHDNEQRLQQGSAGEKVALEILCKLKRYDLVTGQPALQARLDPQSPEYNPARGHTLEGALRLVLSIPSSAKCVANPPNSPGSKAKKKQAPSIVREVEDALAGKGGTAASPFTSPSTSTPHRSSPAPRRKASTPTHRAPPPAKHKAPTSSTPAPAPSSTPAPSTTTATPATTPSPTPSTPTTTTPAPEEHTPPGHGGEPPGQEKKHHGVLCVELLHVVTVGACE